MKIACPGEQRWNVTVPVHLTQIQFSNHMVPHVIDCLNGKMQKALNAPVTLRIGYELIETVFLQGSQDAKIFIKLVQPLS